MKPNAPKPCRVSTCTRKACARHTAYGFCVPHAWGWHLSPEARHRQPPEKYAQRRALLDMVRGEPQRKPAPCPAT